MRRWPYFLAGLLLLPMCGAATRTALGLVESLRDGALHKAPLGLAWLVGGFLLWLVLFFVMSRPVRTYVLAHELTHALWGLLMGARVSRLRVAKAGGSVTLSKTNFLITLAPYFFPFYTMLVIAAHLALSFFYDLGTYEPFWLGLIGLTWSFHLTFTITTLMQHQPDIAEHGAVFSYVIIYLFNLIGLSLWIVAVASPTWAQFAGAFLRDGIAAYGSFLTRAGMLLRLVGGG